MDVIVVAEAEDGTTTYRTTTVSELKTMDTAAIGTGTVFNDLEGAMESIGCSMESSSQHRTVFERLMADIKGCRGVVVVDHYEFIDQVKRRADIKMQRSKKGKRWW